MSNIRTKRWTRSPRGAILGVATGLAEWKALPVDMTRIIVFIIVCCSSFIPGAIIYLVVALILPVQTEDDIITDEEWARRNRKGYRDNYQDVNFEEVKTEKSTEELKREYEELKRKVESMESEMFDREKDWDERFRSSKQ